VKSHLSQNEDVNTILHHERAPPQHAKTGCEQLTGNFIGQ